MKKLLAFAVSILIIAFFTGCGNGAVPKEQESAGRSSGDRPWSIISATSGEIDCPVTEAKNYGGQETGLNCFITVPLAAGADKSALSLRLELPEGAVIAEEEGGCVTAREGNTLTVDLTMENPSITLQNRGYERTYRLVVGETEETP